MFITDDVMMTMKLFYYDEGKIIVRAIFAPLLASPLYRVQYNGIATSCKYTSIYRYIGHNT